MTKQVQLRRGTAAEHAVFTGAVGELTIDTTNDVAVVHDGVTQGGIPLVGTLAEQKILNKTAIGIGTASLDEGLYVTGASTFRGDLFAVPDPTLVYAGIISYFPNQNTVTGIATAGVEVGNLLSVANQIHIGVGATLGAGSTSSVVTGIGQSTITLADTFDTGYFIATTGRWDGYDDGTGNGSNVISGINTAGIVPSQRVVGAGVSDNTRVFQVNVSEVVLDTNGLNSVSGNTLQTGSSTAGSDVLSVDDTADGISVGQVVTDDTNGTANIPAGTTVVAILSLTSVRISNNAILSQSSDFRFTQDTLFTFAEYSQITFDAYVDTIGIGSIKAGELNLTKSAKIEKNLEVTGVATVGAGLSVIGGDLFSQGQIVGQNNAIFAGNVTAVNGILWWCCYCYWTYCK